MLCCILVGFSLIVAVHALPTDKMWGNVTESVKTFKHEGLYFPLQDTLNSRLDNFTDSLMVATSISSGGYSFFDDAMSNYSIKVDGGDKIQALYAYTHNEPVHIWAYGRYWHGYLVFLKPLLLLFNYAQIRSINSMLQLALMVAICAGLFKRNRARFCIPLIAAWYVLCPPAVMLSLQFSTVFYIAFLACLLILLFHERLEKGNYIPFFLVIGAATSFFDLLTYPVFTVILPLTFVLIMRQEKSSSLLATTGDIVACGSSWGVGYGIMWTSKWIIATVTTGRNFIMESASQILMRTSNVSYDGETVTKTEGLMKNIDLLLVTPTQVVLLGCLLILVIMLIKNHRTTSYSLARILPFVFLSVVPAVWLIVTCNHSSIHFWFTFRNLAATVFALYSGILMQIAPPKSIISCKTVYKEEKCT